MDNSTIDIFKCENKILFSYAYKTNGSEDILFNHTLTLPNGLVSSDDSITLIALFARPYNSKKISLHGVCPSREVLDYLSKNIKSEITSKSIRINSQMERNILRTTPDDLVLAFSGGFDSIASMALIENKAKLASIDFGGNFIRERSFFEKFDTIIFEWDIRRQCDSRGKKFNENQDWRFLLSPLISLKRAFATYGILTGTILEASPFWFSSTPRTPFNRYGETAGPLAYLINPVGGLSEYSTTLIAEQYLSKDSLENSLHSLAAEGSFKRYRKKILLHTINYGSAKISEIETPKKLHEFGRSFGEDCVAMYMAWRHGIDWTRKHYCHNMPEHGIDMSFFEKCHTGNMEFIDPEFRDELMINIKKYGIELMKNDDLNNIATSSMFRKNWIDSNNHSR